MEHQSNHTTWLETIVDLVIIEPFEEGLVCVDNFKKIISKYSHRKNKILSITACSNVTGIKTPYMDMAKQHTSIAGFVDFACSAPYVEINMHEDDKKGRYLDAIFFSPHKFLDISSSGI